MGKYSPRPQTAGPPNIDKAVEVTSNRPQTAAPIGARGIGLSPRESEDEGCAAKLPSINKTSSDTINYLKLGTTISLSDHSTETASRVYIRSRGMLNHRAPCYPCAVPDVSKELLDETIKRRTIHKTSLEQDPTVFRKKNLPESTSDYLFNKHIVRDYLTSMHPYYDPDNIGGRIYTISRIKLMQEQDQLKQKELEQKRDELAQQLQQNNDDGVPSSINFVNKNEDPKKHDDDGRPLESPLPILNKRKLKSSRRDKHRGRHARNKSREMAKSNEIDEQMPGQRKDGPRASTAPGKKESLYSKIRDPNTISAMWYQSYVDSIAKKKKDFESKREKMKTLLREQKLAQDERNDLQEFENSLLAKLAKATTC